ncbi:integrator complex subunit 10 [Copidosoma floridanum]|uniref:integrator complex subunit 10 n=1 Tax=Copidosoma floridanum TaxID=29053 RepID=UPI0006C958E6|nr:integrator complex subunit 10 [Copidosoma floridanum]
MEVMENSPLSKEDYLIRRANEALSTDIHSAKSWLITAKSLFPHSAKVQFEAYRIEKLSKNVAEAAKCFSEMFQNFPNDKEIWKEIERLTFSLRTEQCDEDSQFLSLIFQYLPQDLQHRLLIMTADHSEDTMEHCKLLLLLLKRFPQTVATYGPRLVETLLTAEKHSHSGKAVNEFRKLLACEALPILGSAPVELNPKLSLRLLCKAVEFYFACIQQPQDSQVARPWDFMFQVIELMGQKLGWELSNFFSTAWNRDTYCDRLQKFASAHTNELNHSSGITEDPIVRQLLLCSIIVMVRVLTEHTALINSDQLPYCLVEAFADPVTLVTEPKVKKRKREEPLGVVITCDGEYNGHGLALFVKLYDLVHSTDNMQRECSKIIQQMRLESWLNPFLNDLTMYKGLHHDLLLRLPQETNPVCMQLRMASSCFSVKDYKTMVDYVTCVVSSLPNVEGKVSNKLTVPAARHLHYLTLARYPIVQYCCKLLLSAIKDSFSWPGGGGDLALGHALVLMQIDWPQEVQFLHVILERILNRRSLSYPLFTAYVINVDILEELAYIWSDDHVGGGVFLDIATTTGVLQNRRISTRNADKGQREEIKQIIRRQVARDGVDALDELLQRFILNEKKALQHSLVLR